MLCQLKIAKSISSCIRTFHKINLRNFEMEIPTAYFRLQDGSQQFQVSFFYRDESLNIKREFNFNRQLSETVDDFLNRVKANIEKISSKKKRKNKCDNTSGSNVCELETELISDTKRVAGTEVCKDVFFSGNYSNLILRMSGKNYLVSVNTPWVVNLTVPSSIMVGFPVYPSKLELLFANRLNCLYRWFKAKVHSQNVMSTSIVWKDVGTGFMYMPNTDDIGCYLKFECTPGNGKLTGPSTVAISTNTIEAGPGICPFETRHVFTSTRLKENEFRVITYNILADVYAETEAALNELFPYCPRYALSIDYRKQLLLKEIIGYNSDIICLQEVDDKVYSNDLDPVLSPLGYSGSYSQKGGTVREGVACFYLENRFECLDSHTIILGEEVQNNTCLSSILDCINKKESLKKRVIDRHTCLQVVVLRSKDNPNEILLIGNTHLYFHPDADHVRLLQAGIIINYLTHHVSVVASKNPGSYISLLLCGDFNSVPECGIYKLLMTKHVPKDYIDWKSNTDEKVEGLELNQPWNFDSACGTPKYTNFTAGFAACLDYIYYQVERLSVKQGVPFPSEEELRLHTAIPSVVFPSDHIALVADLQWNK